MSEKTGLEPTVHRLCAALADRINADLDVRWRPDRPLRTAAWDGEILSDAIVALTAHHGKDIRADGPSFGAIGPIADILHRNGFDPAAVRAAVEAWQPTAEASR